MRRFRAISLCLSMSLVALGGARPSHSTPPTFREVGPGIAYATFDVASAAGDGPALRGHAFEIELARVELRMLPAGSAPNDARFVHEIAAPFPRHVAINASFFDEARKAMGRVVDRGETLTSSRLRAWGALVVEGSRARVVLGSALPERKGGGDLVVQGIPRLVIEGQPPRLKPQIAARTALCAEDARLILVVTTAPARSDTFARFLAAPRSAGGLGCRNALNLDGGPSTQLDVRLPGLDLRVSGGWGVPNALVVVPR